MEQIEKSKWLELINSRFEEICNTLESASRLSMFTGTIVDVYLYEDGTIATLQALSHNCYPSELNERCIHIVTFELGPDFVFENMDQSDVKEVLEDYGMSEQEIKDYIAWYEENFTGYVRLSSIIEYNPTLGRELFEDCVDGLILNELNPIDIISDLLKTFKGE